MAAQGISVVVDAISAQGIGNLAVHLVSPQGAMLPAFEAGAHVDVHLPGGPIRQYSIASSPATLEHYVICVKHEARSRGGSAHVHTRLRVGDALRISTPRNLFALAPAGHYILLAGGIGITPLLSMAQALDAASKAFELHYYVATRAALAFRKRLARGFRFGVVHIHPADEGEDCRNLIPERLVSPESSTRVYMCGPAGFMAYLRSCAKAEGWRDEQVHWEAFSAPAIESGAVADHPDHGFEIELASSKKIYFVPSDRTIASVLSEAQVPISLSCEMGICGACLTPVLAGEVDHRDSLQSDAEKTAARQNVAICCSRSRSARLVLDL